MWERAEISQTAAASGRPKRQTFVIIDLRGLGLGFPCSGALKFIVRRFFDVSQNYFLETYVPVLRVNPPSTPSPLCVVAWAS